MQGIYKLILETKKKKYLILLVEDLDGNAMEPEREKSPPQPRFASSKWETVDEAELEAQGSMTLRVFVQKQ